MSIADGDFCVAHTIEVMFDLWVGLGSVTETRIESFLGEWGFELEAVGGITWNNGTLP